MTTQHGVLSDSEIKRAIKQGWIGADAPFLHLRARPRQETGAQPVGGLAQPEIKGGIYRVRRKDAVDVPGRGVHRTVTTVDVYEDAAEPSDRR